MGCSKSGTLLTADKQGRFTGKISQLIQVQRRNLA